MSILFTPCQKYLLPIPPPQTAPTTNWWYKITTDKLIHQPTTARDVIVKTETQQQLNNPPDGQPS